MQKLIAPLVVVLTLGLAPTAGAQLDWRTGFEKPGFNTWTTTFAKPGDLRRVERRWAAGRYALRVRVTSRSCPMTTDLLRGECKRQRAQLKKSVGEHSGVDSWWSFKVRWPVRYRPAVRKYNVFMQWHGRGPFIGQGSNLTFDLKRKARHGRAVHPYMAMRGCSYRQTCGRTLSLPALRKGRWHRFVLHANWSIRSDGFVDLWINGHKVGRTAGPNVYRDVKAPDVWLQAGIYRGDADHTSIIYLDAIRHGNTARDVRG